MSEQTLEMRYGIICGPDKHWAEVLAYDPNVGRSVPRPDFIKWCNEVYRFQPIISETEWEQPIRHENPLRGGLLPSVQMATITFASEKDLLLFMLKCQ